VTTGSEGKIAFVFLDYHNDVSRRDEFNADYLLFFFPVTEGEFREFFEQFGVLIDSVVMFDRDTGRSRGFGFVTFEDEVS
jgi:RNA recognition motif-containing protein